MKPAGVVLSVCTYLSVLLSSVLSLRCYDCGNMYMTSAKEEVRRPCEDPFQPDSPFIQRLVCPMDYPYCEKFIRRRTDAEIANLTIPILGGISFVPNVEIRRGCTINCIPFGEWWDPVIHRCCLSDYCNEAAGLAPRGAFFAAALIILRTVLGLL